MSGSSVKAWFQYRCERKTRYETLSPDERAVIPVIAPPQPGEWATFGLDFEVRVVKALRSTAKVYMPTRGQRTHDDETTRSFVTGRRPDEYAYQLRLETTPWLEENLAAGPDISITYGFPDIVKLTRDNGTLVFELADIKATHVATPFHKVQVAYYALMLEGMLRRLNVAARIAETASIWRLTEDDDGQTGRFFPETFRVASYAELVRDFFRRKTPALRDVAIGPGRDDTFFHVYYKCEQCQYLEHCYAAVSKADAGSRDISAVPGLSHDSKRALWSSGVRTVRDLAATRSLVTVNRTESWSLQRNAEMLVARAKAIESGTVTRHSNAFSLQMPPRVDAALILLADYDPVAGNLTSLGYLYSGGSEKREMIEVLASADRASEATAIKRVLGQALSDLAAIDAANATGAELHAHIFVYEPAEAVYLKEAIGRHLNDPGICVGLLNMIRIFPPDQAVPEPEFRGVHHLPASAVRSIVEQLYAVPVTSSYDLRQVSEALAGAEYALSDPYRPQAGFERRFSAMLPLEVARRLRRGEMAEDLVREDVRQRLRTTASIVDWLLRENSRAVIPFLRLKKQPFRFQGEFNPLDATDIDILHAYTLLENRSSLLERLAALAQPARRRRDSLRCFSDMDLKAQWKFGRQHCMEFRVPADSKDAELSPDTYGIVLTHDDPDILLDPACWENYRVKIEDVRATSSGAVVRVLMRQDIYEQYMEPLVRNRPEKKWFLDEIFTDPNSPRLASFLEYLSGGTAQ